ncbi:MAG: hypothetical protein NZ551_11195 [Microscillaceae bacterium]|nr:hypothetical protein [Microscillaceae bacterium]MDW8461762.1 hypothetical protein [Cytophagales bacterium]
MGQNILFVLFFISSWGYIIYRLYKQQKNSPLILIFYAALITKTLAGFLHAAVFFFYYREGDLIAYHHDSIVLAKYALKHPLRFLEFFIWNTYIPLPDLENFTIYNQPRALLMLKVNSLLYLLAGEEIILVILLLSTLSFWVTWLFTNELTSWFPNHKWEAYIAFLFFPSVLIWSSGINKECYALISIYGILWIVFRWKRLGINLNKEFLGGILLLFVFTYWLFQVKSYYFIVLGLCLGGWGIGEYLYKTSLRLNKPWIFPLLSIGIFLFFTIVFFSNSYKDFSFLGISQTIIKNHNVNYILSSSQGLIHFYKVGKEAFITLSPTLESFIVNSPLALISALYRPFVWEAHNKLQLLAGIENLVILLVSLQAIFLLFTSKIHVKNIFLLVFALIYIILLAILLAFSFPNLGSLNRLRVSFMPFFLYLLLIVVLPIWRTWWQAFQKRKQVVT